MTDGDTIDIEVSPSEKARHPVQDTGFIFNKSH
jgi:hypothetical protein